MMDSQIPDMAPATLRLHEARYFLDRFVQYCGSEDDRYRWFELIAYADAFVMCLVSVEEMVKQRKGARNTTRDTLQRTPLFRFMKAVRNISVHESVLPAPKQRRGAQSTVSRIINVNVGVNQWVEPRISIPAIRNTLTRVLRKRRQEKKTIEGAREFLTEWVKVNGNGTIPLVDLFRDALEKVADICKVKLD